MPSARPAPRPLVLPDRTVDDVKDVCERIHELAAERGWDLKRLGEKAGHAWQSFNNWKQGHQSPKVNLLQDFAASVGGRIRVTLEAVDVGQGHTVLIPPGVGGETTLARTTREDEDLAAYLDRIGVTDPGIRKKAAEAARTAATKAVVAEYKTGNPTQPTAAQPSPSSRGRRKISSGK